MRKLRLKVGDPLPRAKSGTLGDPASLWECSISLIYPGALPGEVDIKQEGPIRPGMLASNLASPY